MKITPNTDLSKLLPKKQQQQQQQQQQQDKKEQQQQLITTASTIKAKVALDLPKKPLPRKPKRQTATRTRAKTPRSARGGPPTPLLRWDFHKAAQQKQQQLEQGERKELIDEENGNNVGVRKQVKSSHHVSVRKLGAALWRLQVNVEGGEGGGEERKKRRESGVGDDDDDGDRDDEEEEEEDRGKKTLVGYKVCFNSLFEKHTSTTHAHDTQDLFFNFLFKPGVGHGGDRLSCRHASRECGSEGKDPLRSPCSVNGPINGYLCERQSPFRYANYDMEGATKWDPVCSNASDENHEDTKLLDQNINAASMISTLEAELQQARTRIEELETERRTSKKKIEHFLKKLSEERATWRSREHEKVRAIIDDVKGDLSRERKNRQRLEIVNSKLVNELSEAKMTAKRYMQDYEKERKARELIEEVCDELAKEIGEDKAEVDSLKKECMQLREEVDDERKMLQMAEVWREERVQMKLIDAKVALDQRYTQMNLLVAELKKFLSSKGVSLDDNEMREVEMFRRAAASINIKDIKEFTYEPSNSDDIFAVVEEMAMAESNEREIEPCVEYSSASHASHVHSMSPDIKNHSRDSIHRLSNVYINQNGDVDDDGSTGWETVSHAEDQGSSYSPDGSVMSVNKMCRDSNVSGSCTEWEEQVGDETPETEISEVCSVKSKQLKKVKSISRLWRSGANNSGDNYKIISVDGVHARLSNGRVSTNGGMMSPDRLSGKGGMSPSDMVGWSSPDTGNPHINRGMKGCIEWPRQKNSLKHKLLEARMESQKVQLRHVLKQKI